MSEKRLKMNKKDQKQVKNDDFSANSIFKKLEFITQT